MPSRCGPKQRYWIPGMIRVFAIADACGLPVRVGALRNSNSNLFYVRHGFQLITEDEFDNSYIRNNQPNF